MITSAEEFVRLRTSEIQEEYHRAAHEEAPEEVWWDVVSRYPEMIRWVIDNKTVPLSILEHFATNSDPWIRLEVARKRKLSRHLFQLLAEDTDETVRARVALNAKVPIDILEQLAHDENKWVAEQAHQRLASRQ